MDLFELIGHCLLPPHCFNLRTFFAIRPYIGVIFVVGICCCCCFHIASEAQAMRASNARKQSYEKLAMPHNYTQTRSMWPRWALEKMRSFRWFCTETASLAIYLYHQCSHPHQYHCANCVFVYTRTSQQNLVSMFVVFWIRHTTRRRKSKLFAFKISLSMYGWEYFEWNDRGGNLLWESITLSARRAMSKNWTYVLRSNKIKNTFDERICNRDGSGSYGFDIKIQLYKSRTAKRLCLCLWLLLLLLLCTFARLSLQMLVSIVSLFRISIWHTLHVKRKKKQQN